MNFKSAFLFQGVVIFLSLAGCTHIDPESVDDPIGDGALQTVKISVCTGEENQTKADVYAVQDDAGHTYGVLRFTDEDRMHLYEIDMHKDGRFSVLYYYSKETVVTDDGKRADFTFDLTPNKDTTVTEKFFFAAMGDWGLSGGNPCFNIPANITIDDEGRSVLPQNGVVAVSDVYHSSATDMIFDSTVRMVNVACYGLMKISGLEGKNITKIQVERENGRPLAGKTTIKATSIIPDNFSISDGDSYRKNGAELVDAMTWNMSDAKSTDDVPFESFFCISPSDITTCPDITFEIIFDPSMYGDATSFSDDLSVFSALKSDDDSATTISIKPSKGVQESIKNGDDTCVWFTTIPVACGILSQLIITLTDSDGHRFKCSYHCHGAYAGQLIEIPLSEWTEVD